MAVQAMSRDLTLDYSKTITVDVHYRTLIRVYIFPSKGAKSKSTFMRASSEKVMSLNSTDYFTIRIARLMSKWTAGVPFS